MKACMMYSTSTISTTLETDMLILVSKPTECAAECMIILSEFLFVNAIIQSEFHPVGRGTGGRNLHSFPPKHLTLTKQVLCMCNVTIM